MAKFHIEDMSAGGNMPVRATRSSAGYDFTMDHDVEIPPGGDVVVETGVSIEMDPMQFLMVVPRSGLGFKHGIRLANTVGIIDSDYYPNTIKIKLHNPGGEKVSIPAGKGIAQGIIMCYNVTDDDKPGGARTGGFGSTDKA